MFRHLMGKIWVQTTVKPDTHSATMRSSHLNQVGGAEIPKQKSTGNSNLIPILSIIHSCLNPFVYRGGKELSRYKMYFYYTAEKNKKKKRKYKHTAKIMSDIICCKAEKNVAK